MATKPVKHFHSEMAGAPVLNGSAGALIAVLDACLVNGFNLVTLDSLVVTDGVLTGTKAGHGYVPDQVILTAGAAQPVLNGEWTIVSTTSNTFTAAATGVANVVGSGAITAKAAPAGWEKTFSGDGKAAYRSLDPTATGFFLRVDDTAAATARVVGYEDMTDIDTGSGAFPTADQVAGGAFWRKSAGGSPTSRRWVIAADSMMFYYVPETLDSTAKTLDAFGDYTSYKAGDGYACLLTGYVSAPDGNPVSGIGWSDGTTPTNAKIWMARSYSQLGSAVPASTASMTGWSSSHTVTGDSGNYLTYPSPVDNGLILVDPILMEGSTGGAGNVIKGALPGLFFTPQRAPAAHKDKILDVVGLPGRTVMMISYYCFYSTESRCAVDISGPWR